MKRSLVAAQEAAEAEAASRAAGQRGRAERAVLVAVEFTAQRRKLTAAAQQAKKAAAVVSLDLRGGGSELDDEVPEGWEAAFGGPVGAGVPTWKTVAKAAVDEGAGTVAAAPALRGSASGCGS